ncbi:MlaD family protein [Tropicimonas isoalkanivorans]|uniref:Paraquat-inducible protein B n=1 Tax=Tropicimonas isoalkanivorans TaxID=441112 RepID=A0A1I1P865_9RHOB|nr:MlaD family protein [Tropicimonas isoalkanivorans]SFD05792.1 paraquat-inducible protein B [Tropicimonas isoalkanivorans]
MTDDPDQIPQTPVKPARRSLLDRISIVWVIPATALVIALAIAWHNLQNRGAVIEIAFTNAAGIVADQTELRFREVSVGVVEEVTFAPGLDSVVAHVRLDKEVEPYVDSEAVFWVVQPEVSARGITGLNTVLSGVYIEGSWDGEPRGLHRKFTGENYRPIARPDMKGKRIVLGSTTGKGLKEGTPILYKGLEVGRIGRPQLSPDGVTITAEAFIEAPHDQLLSTRSRFWDSSGFSFNLGAGGAEVSVESLSALISGGISFETVVSGGAPVEDDQEFSVFASQDDARTSLFENQGKGGPKIEVAVVFEENVTGLVVGAPVTLRGLEIGEVVGLTGKVDEAQFGDDRVRLVVVLALEPEQLQLGPDANGPEAILDFFQEAVEDGWRARLARASLLTGGLKIEFVQIPDADPASFARDADPYPILPSVPAEIEGVGASAEGLLSRVSELPIEDLLNSVVDLAQNAAALVSSDEIQSLPAEIKGAVTDIREVIGSEQILQLPDRLGAIGDEIVAVLEDLRAREGVAKLVAAVEDAGEAAQSIATAAEGVPALIERVESVAAKAEALDLEALLGQATGLVESAQAIIGTDAARALPDSLNTALGGLDSAVQEATDLLADLNEADAAARLSEAVAAAGEAASEISSAAEGVPALVERVEAVAAKAEALDLETALGRATGLLEDAQAVIGTEAARGLPARLSNSLAELDGAVAEATTLLASVNEGDPAAELNRALAAAGDAATKVNEAVEGVPALVERIDAVAAQAQQMDLDALSAQLSALLESADALIDTEAARALPASLNGALEQVRAAVAELRAGGTVENVNATLVSAREAAGAVADVSNDLPQLVRETEAVLRQAEQALVVFSDSGTLNREARDSLREVSRAAEAVRSLARTLERKPNALITGR